MGEFEVAWKTTSSQEATEEEARLLRHYYWDHSELPPDNHSEPLREVRQDMETVARYMEAQECYRGRSPAEVRKMVEPFITYCSKTFLTHIEAHAERRGSEPTAILGPRSANEASDGS
jgi:hypothetical protein